MVEIPAYEEGLLVPYAPSPAWSGTILVLAPHPDDEVFGCGGVCALAAAAGARVVPVLLTSGEAGVGDGEPGGDGTARQRLAESERAATRLGTDAPRTLGFADRSLAGRGEELVAAIAALLAELKPDVVLAPSPAEIHPDHRATARATHLAFLRVWPEAPARLVFYEVSAPLSPNRLVDIDAVAPRKAAAVAAFESQLGQLSYDEFTAALARFRAMTLPGGVARAEAFLELTRDEVAALPWRAIARRAGAERPDAFAPATRLSVVVPTFERPQALERTLSALETQRASLPFGVELVVVDDGSRDGTGELLAGWASRTRGAKVFSQPNSGPARARNRGAREASGELLLFLGDDTVPQAGFLAAHERAHRLGGPGPLAVLGYTTWDRERMRVTPFLRHLNENGLQFGYAIIPDPDDVPFNFFYTSNVSLPRGTFLALGGFDEEFPHAAWEDVELAYRAAQTEPPLRIVYRPAARTLHDHPTDLPSFRRRQRKCGVAAATFARKHPELSGWLGLAEAGVGSDARPVPLRLAEHAIQLLDPLGIPLPPRLYDRVLRWDYVAGIREARGSGA